MVTPSDIHRAAVKEIEEENYRVAVDAEKERIRQHVPLLHRLFPWKITITRR